MKYQKLSQNKYAKARYRVRIWAEYEAGLRCRGDLTDWLSEDAIDSWREPPSVPAPQHDDPPRDAPEPPSGMIPLSEDRGSFLSSEPCTNAKKRLRIRPVSA